MKKETFYWKCDKCGVFEHCESLAEAHKMADAHDKETHFTKKKKVYETCFGVEVS